MNLAAGFNLGEWTVFPAEGVVERQGEKSRLEPRVMAVLVELAEHSGEVVNKSHLLDKIWTDSIVEDSSLMRCISDIRRVFGEDPKEPRYIQTIHRKGYRLIEHPRPLALQGSEPDRSRYYRAAIIALPAIIILVAAAATIIKLRFLPGNQRSVVCVFVAPFSNLDEDAENGFFAIGLTEDIITKISKIPSIRIISWKSVRNRYNSTTESCNIGRDLGVDVVLEGNVRRENDTIRITSQLTDAESGTILWADKYDKRIDDIFHIQDNVAQSIARTLSTRFGIQNIQVSTEAPTSDMNAYNLFLKGCEAYNKNRRDENENAVVFFNEAIRIDPSFALAHAWLAKAYALKVSNFGFDPELVSIALQEGTRALELDPDLPESYLAMGKVHDAMGKFGAGLEFYLEANRRLPGYPDAIARISVSHHALGNLDLATHWQWRYINLAPEPVPWANMALYLAETGLIREAEPWLERALQSAPNNLWVLGVTSYVMTIANDSESASRAAEQMITVHPNSYWAALVNGELEVRSGRYECATQHFKRAVELEGAYNPPYESRARLRLAAIQWERGDRIAAAEALEAITDTALVAIEGGNEAPSHRWILAAAAAIKGEHREAIEWYRKAFDAGHRQLLWDVSDPLFWRLHNDERFCRELEPMSVAVQQMRSEVERADWFDDLVEAGSRWRAEGAEVAGG